MLASRQRSHESSCARIRGTTWAATAFERICCIERYTRGDEIANLV